MSFTHEVNTVEELRALIGVPGPRAVGKERSGLDDRSRAFVELSPFVVMATAGRDGRCDVSPKGDRPGFVQVLDDHRLVLPDRPGNRRLDGMSNILDNPHVGLLFIVPGREETLRVNGRASITRAPDLLRRCAVDGQTPRLAVGVDVEQAFFHCSKSFLRARLWQQAHWPAPDALPSLATALFEQIRPDDASLEDYERELAEDRTRLY